jgi:hypothetical protein
MFERACALGPKDRNDHNQKECIVEIDEPERRYVQRKDQKNEAISPNRSVIKVGRRKTLPSTTLKINHAMPRSSMSRSQEVIRLR